MRWLSRSSWLLLVLLAAELPGGEPSASSATRLLDAVGTLASDEMEGRGVGTKGLDLAAQYIGEQFAQIGLRTDVCDGTAYQTFSLPAPPALGPPEENWLVIRGPGEGAAVRTISCAAGVEFNTLAAGGSGTAQGPLVFVGYGITAPDWKYDDYAGLDVQGRVVVMLRNEPQQGDVLSLFNGAGSSQHARLRRKIENARQHGAAAAIIVNDAYSLRMLGTKEQKSWRHAVNRLTAAVEDFSAKTTWTEDLVKQSQAKLAELAAAVAATGSAAQADQERLVELDAADGILTGTPIPAFFCRRRVIEDAVGAAWQTDLGILEQQLDHGPTPRSGPLEGWTAECQSSVVDVKHELKNVVGVCEGRGDLADETIVVGAHYDHLGRGDSPDGEIRNGADDNASGVAGILEIARRLAAEDVPARRRLVFMALAGEELGLLGSRKYVQTPLFPLDKTVAMINLDMVGRMRDNRLTIGGTGSAKEFDGLIDEVNSTYRFDLSRMPSGRGPSDHASFFQAQIPVLFFYTNEHEDYHRPTDDVEKINVAGLLGVTDFVTELVRKLAVAPQRPTYER